MEELFRNNWWTVQLVKPNYPHFVANKAGVVVVPYFKGNFVLESNTKMGQKKFEFPRGYVESSDVSFGLAGQRELEEELGLYNTEIVADLGEVNPDSSMITTTIHVVVLNVLSVDNYNFQKSENVVGYEVWSLAEIRAHIADGSLTDAYTLSAFVKWLAANGF